MTVEALQTDMEIPYWVKFRFGHILDHNVMNIKLNHQQNTHRFQHLRYL